MKSNDSHGEILAKPNVHGYFTNLPRYFIEEILFLKTAISTTVHPQAKTTIVKNAV